MTRRVAFAVLHVSSPTCTPSTGTVRPASRIAATTLWVLDRTFADREFVVDLEEVGIAFPADHHLPDQRRKIAEFRLERMWAGPAAPR